MNRQTKVIDAEGKSVEYQYDAAGNFLGYIDKNGHQQTIVYDELNRIKKVIDATGNFTELEYDAASNVKNIMNARGDTAHFDYDDLYRVIGFTDPSGNTTRFSYNSQNQMTHITDPNNNTVEYVFNARNELVRLIDASGAVTKYEYDPAGKLKKIFDAKNNVTEFYYDALYRLTSWGNPVINNYEFFTYDNNGNLLTAQNANQGTTYFYYDAFNRIQTIATSQGLTQSFQYDDVGNLINRTDYNQVSTTYTYDNLSRITEIQYPVGKVEVTYDPMGSILSVGNRGIGLNDTTYLVYDSLDRPISFSIDYGIFNKTVCYTYDELGQIKTMTDADSKTTTYEYDKAKRLISLITSDQNVTTFGYDPASRRIQTTYPNGVYTTYGYDTVDRLVNITTRNSNQEIITNYSYLYDKVGNRIQMSDHTGMATTYTYDEINRLIDTVYPSGEHIHDYYDAGGNRATRVINDTSYTYYFNDAENHLLSDGTYNYGYDNNGNLISKTDISSTTSYTYDFENRLVNISNTNGPSAEYYYTPYGFRIGKTTADQTQYYFYSFEQIIHELTSDGSTQKSITYGPWVDEPLSVLYNSSSYYYHFDGLKSVTALTNASEQLVNQYTYDAFGNIQSLLENVPNRFTFTGREYDSESGLYFYRERYYDPSLGRMLTKDLPCFSTTLNYYPYADNNPVNVIDPFGLETYQVGGDAQNPLNGDINPNNNPFKVEGAGGSGWFQWCGNSLKYIGNEDPGPNSDSWLPVTVLDENGKESGTRYCPNPDKWQDATDAQLLLILKEELLDKVLGEKDQILRQVLTTYFENNPDNPNVIKIAMRIIKGTLNRECFADIAKDVAILMLEEIIDHFSGEMLGEMGVDEALGLVIDLANGYAGKISPEYKEVSEFLTSSPVIQLLQWANNKIGSVCGGTQITPSPTPSPTPPFQPGRPNQQKITPSPKPSPDPAPEPTPKPPEQPTPPKPPQQSGGTGSSQKGTGASFGDPIEPGNEDDRRGPEFFWFYPDWKFKWWPDYQVTPNGGGWGSPPGEGGYIFIDDPPGYCVYRVVYFGQNAIDDLFENHQALYNAIKWIAKENNMVTTTVLIMPGRGGDEEWSKWIAFEAKYPDISVSRWSDDPIERTTVTYSGLKTKNADVLIDSDHFSATQQGGYYTPEEIEAIQKYLLDEHGYIATSGTLGDTPGQSNQTTSLLSLLGLKETDGNPHKYTNMNSWVFDDPAHPIFFNISSGWNPGGVTGNVDIGICPLCGEPHLSAKIAHLQSTEGNHQSIISAYTIWSPLATNGLLGEAPIGCSVVPQTVYFGNNVIENTGNNHEILYNAIKWAAEHDSTDETKVLIMPGWGGDTGWSQWQTFASAHPDINLTRWSTSSTSRNPVTTYQLEASDADVLIDNEHSSPTQQGGFYTEGELQAIEWYVKTKGNGYIVTSGSVGNHSLQTDQTQTLMQLLGIKQTAIIGQYENSETWIIDQPYHPLIDGIDSWNPGNITGNLDVEKAIKIAHLYSTEDNHQTIISAYEGLEKGSCGCECNIPPVANFTWNPPNPTIQQTIQFSDLSEDIDGTIVNWTWNFGDGNISSLQDPTHYYSAINTYEVTLSVRDNVGDTASRTKTITIIPGGPVVNLNTTEYFLTIQAAINDSDTINGHTIYIGNGTYNEHILLHKRLTLIGENIQTTIIDGSNTSTVLTIVTDFCRLHNLTITRGGTNNCINITHANYTTISDTLLTYSENGIFLGESWYTTIMRNNASHNNDDGVEIAQNSKYTLIQNNSFYHNGAGVFINHATNNTIDHNIIQDSTAFGIQLFDQAHDNRITNNTIQGTTGEQYPQDVDGDAICLFYYSSNPIYRCLVENNILNDNLRGVTLQQTYQTVIRQNNISNCSEIGIKIYSPSNNNQIYHNNIYSNLINANDGGTNIWDDGYPSGGNYWGNYTGFDLFSGPGQNISGSDGIGDTPYNILGKTPPNQDRYPFMVRNGWLLNRPPTQPTDTTSWHIYPGDLYKGIGGYPGRYGGQPVTYQSTSTEAGSDLYFNFSWGDGNNTVVGPVSGFANATHTYGHWGMYNITVTVKHGPSGIPSNSSTARTVNMYKAGDINLDNRVTFADIDPFVETLSGHAAYAAAHPDKYWFTGDTNFNHAVTFADIDPFVALIGT